MYKVTIQFPQGATILDEDQTLVTVERHVNTHEQVNALQKAALTLGAKNVEIYQDKR